MDVAIMSVVYVLTTPIPKDGDDATMEQLRKRVKWDNDDYVCRGIECIFVGYGELSKTFRFYVIEPNKSVLINSIIESRDVIFEENIFSSFPRRSLRIPNGIEDIGGLVVHKEITEEVVTQQTELDLKKVPRICTIRLLIAMTSIHILIIHQMGVKIAFLNGELNEEVELTKEFLSSKFSMKDMEGADVILVKKFNYFDCTPLSTPTDTSEKLMPDNGQVVSQLEYFKVFGCLMYVMTCTRPDIAFAMGKLSRSAMLKTIRLPVAGYSCLVEV
ncbi:zinc finger, CCHC-type containing protein [Tanacetum coccineum]